MVRFIAQNVLHEHVTFRRYSSIAPWRYHCESDMPHDLCDEAPFANPKNSAILPCNRQSWLESEPRLVLPNPRRSQIIRLTWDFEVMFCRWLDDVPKVKEVADAEIGRASCRER